MARVGRGQMSDRREDITTASVKCYIYNSKTDIPEPTPVIPEPTPVIPVVVPVVPITPVTPVVVPTTPTQPVHNAPVVTPTTPVVPIVTPTVPVVPVVIPTVPVVIPQNSIGKKLDLEFKDLSDIAEHFLTQNDLVFSLVTKSPLRLGEVATLTLEIKDKNT